ncbi:hypothetical protein H5T56_05815 [Candidatus Bipolaricaulota bacterium]|nr:hypothetical protein [Candidatus Bipolaricaulota bacterium]
MLVLMVGALGLAALGASVSRTATVSLSIPALSVLALPERGLSGREVMVELRPEELVQGLVLPLEVKSNVPWAVTARVLSADRVDLLVRVLGGPEVLVNTEEVLLLSGRSGKHEVSLEVKLVNLGSETDGITLVLKLGGSAGARVG